MLRVEVARDEAGRPEAIRIRVGGARLAFGRFWRRLPAAPRFLGAPVRFVVRGVRAGVRGVRRGGARVLSGVPRASLRRDAAGWPHAIVLRVGRDPAVDPSAGSDSRGEPLHRRARHLLRSAMAAVSTTLPWPRLERDALGRPAAVRVRVGREDPAPAAASAASPGRREKPKKWVIEPAAAGLFSQLQEFWRYRRMLWFFSVRGIQRMYQGMNLGIFWLFARPLLPIAISTLVFGRLLGVPSEGVPYFLFFLAGMTSWMLFERATLWATRSLDMNKGLVKKVYFPRLIIPVSSVAPAVVDAFTYSGLLVAAAIFYLAHDGRWYLRLGPSLWVAALAAAFSVVLAIGVGLWTCIWQTRFREVRFTLRYVLRFWNYLTPVLYPLSAVPKEYHWLVFLNPMAPLVETFKWGILGIGEFNVEATATGIGVTVVVVVSGLWYFNRFEASSVDRL